MTALLPDDTTPSAELAPRRMLEAGADHERRLLASARLDRVPRAAQARVAAALGGVLEPRAAPTELEPARAALPRSGTRWGLGVLGAGVVGAIALSFWLRAAPGESASAAAGWSPASSSPAASSSEPATAEAEGPTPTAPAELTPQRPELTPQQAELTQQTLAPQADRSEPARPRKRAPEPVASDLLAEVRALEAVNSALSAAQLGRAARELAAYHRRFAHGELAIEADVLAIQLAVARGDNAAASARAEQLLARPEAEHYRARVHALLGSEGQPALSTDRQNTEQGRSNEPAPHMRARR